MAESPSQHLGDDQLEAIVARLKAGEYLDEYLRPLLFRQAKEYELDYAGKTPKSRLLAETMAVPLQQLKQFGTDGGDWTSKLVFGDNLQVLKTLMDMKSRGEVASADGTHGVRLCYIDPPFATRQEFRGRRGPRAYRDKVAGAAFVEFLRKRLAFVYELLAEGGLLWVHLDTRKVHYIKVILDDLFGEESFRNEVVWKRTTAHSDAATMGGVHETILVYSKGAVAKWNQLYVPYEQWYVDQYYRYEDDDGRRYASGDVAAAGPGPARTFRGELRDPPPGSHWRFSQEKLDELIADGRIFFTRNGFPRFKRYLEGTSAPAIARVVTRAAVAPCRSMPPCSRRCSFRASRRC